MNLSQKIIRQRLSPDGGVYRKLPLFTLSCAAYGYAVLIQKITGVSYGQVGAEGKQKGWQTYYAMDRIVRRISDKMKHDRHWISRTRLQAKKDCQDFAAKMQKLAPTATTDPQRFIRFAISQYPRYMAGIGVYNFYWRYLEFADPSMSPFPQRGLRQLSVERNKLADIYPHFEHLLTKAVTILAKKISCNPALLLMMTRTELARTVFRSRLAVPPVELRNRCKGYVYLFAGHHEAVSTRHEDRKQLLTYVKDIFRKHSQQELKGTSVQYGHIVGTVIRTFNRHVWPKNPVYVVSNTHPAEIPYLKKVAAIVTNEGGGILSHAAIVSRELKIPCVIGTKIATKILKDGDRVEVDATKGVVKKL